MIPQNPLWQQEVDKFLQPMPYELKIEGTQRKYLWGPWDAPIYDPDNKNLRVCVVTVLVCPNQGLLYGLWCHGYVLGFFIVFSTRPEPKKMAISRAAAERA